MPFISRPVFDGRTMGTMGEGGRRWRAIDQLGGGRRLFKYCSATLELTVPPGPPDGTQHLALYNVAL